MMKSAKHPTWTWGIMYFSDEVNRCLNAALSSSIGETKVGVCSAVRNGNEANETTIKRRRRKCSSPTAFILIGPHQMCLKMYHLLLVLLGAFSASTTDKFPPFCP